MYNPLINQLALETGTAGVVASHGECPPVLANDVGRHHQLCPAFNNLAIKLIVREYKIKVAILCASWLAYYREVPEDGSHHSPDGFWYKSGNDLYPDMLPMINALKDAGVDQIWIVAPTPTYQIAITEYLLLNDKRGGTREKAQQTYAYHLGRAKQLLNSMERLEQKGHASIAHPYRQFCQDDGNCYAYSDKDIFYSDSNHLTFSGAMNAREAFLPIFAEIKYLQMKSAVASAK